MKPSVMPSLIAGLLLAYPLGAQALNLESELEDIISADQVVAASKHVQDVAAVP